MFTFDRRLFDIVRGHRLRFYKLVVNGKCPFDDFCDEVSLNERDKKSMNSIFAYMNLVASENLKLPKEKFRHIIGTGIDNLYEFKKDCVRIYVILEEPDVYILVGGYKANQKRDIKYASNIAEELLKKEWV